MHGDEEVQPKVEVAMKIHVLPAPAWRGGITGGSLWVVAILRGSGPLPHLLPCTWCLFALIFVSITKETHDLLASL
jgi:hypothetical protein